jgi:hypothetical protein
MTAARAVLNSVNVQVQAGTAGTIEATRMITKEKRSIKEERVIIYYERPIRSIHP